MAQIAINGLTREQLDIIGQQAIEGVAGDTGSTPTGVEAEAICYAVGITSMDDDTLQIAYGPNWTVVGLIVHGKQVTLTIV